MTDNRIYDIDEDGKKIYDGTKLLMLPLNWLFLNRMLITLLKIVIPV